MTLILSLFSALLFAAGPSAGAPADTARASVELSIAPKPEAFYSPARGFGAGAEATLRNLGWEGSRLHLSAVTMTRHGEYGAFLFTAEPREAPLFGAAGLHYIGTRAYTFYGLGPRSHRSDGIRLSARRIEAEARLGWRPLEHLPLVVQPSVRLLHARMRSYEEVEEGALERLASASAESILRSVDSPSTGLSFDLTSALDLLDDARHPRSGALLQASASRYMGIDDDPFGYWRLSTLAHGVVPVVGRRSVVEGRALLAVTRRAGPDRPVPFFALPTFDVELVGGYGRYRVVGRDLVALSAGFRFPVLDVLDLVGAEAFVAVHLGNAYDDVFSQFEPRVSFERDVDRQGRRAPLRPALTLGGYLISLGSGLPIVSGQIGFSPEGLQLAGLDFVVDLRTRRPAVR